LICSLDIGPRAVSGGGKRLHFRTLIATIYRR
jgi:hypothetical protein